MSHWNCGPRCTHPDHIRYGPCKPSVSEKELSIGRRSMHQAEHKRYFENTMNTFADPLVSPQKKVALFEGNLLAPSSLVFEKYGKVLFRHGIGMAMSFHFKKWPQYLFDFNNDFLIILQNTTGKNYEEIERYPIQAIRLSFQTQRDEVKEGEFAEERLTMHATHDMSYYPQAALESYAL